MAWTRTGFGCTRVAAGVVLVGVMGGCGMKLETGYEYRPLNATVAQRRAYYASPFSPEKSAADQEKKSSSSSLGPR